MKIIIKNNEPDCIYSLWIFVANSGQHERKQNT